MDNNNLFFPAYKAPNILYYVTMCAFMYNNVYKLYLYEKFFFIHF